MTRASVIGVRPSMKVVKEKLSCPGSNQPSPGERTSRVNITILADDWMMLAARPPRVRSQPSLRRRDAVAGEYRPPGSEAAFSRPLSRNKKISHRMVYGHASRKPARRRRDVA